MRGQYILNDNKDLIINLQKLQNLKFYMYVVSDYRIDLLKFGLYDYVTENHIIIDLVKEIIAHKKN